MAVHLIASPPRLRRRDHRFAYWIILPAVAGLVLFQYYPMLQALAGSFQSFNPFTHAAGGFVGLDNYHALFADPQFRRAVVNSLLYIVAMIVVEVPLGMLLAQLINRRIAGSAVLRTTVIAALAASETVAILIWNQMFSPNSGVLNALLNAVGLPSQPFTTSPHQALLSLVAISVWKDLGLPTLIFLAGLQSVPTEVYEAASLDGASERRTFLSITVPLLRRSTAVAVFMATVTGSRVFTSILLITQGGPNDSTRNLIYYSYQQGFQYSAYGTAYAATICMLVLLGLVTAAQLFFLREKDSA
ncbi:carbohydrate ABC transporter permease [Kribbella sp. GL6]|uniref:carbohydrate ABC transporter permease n=1 Tax=Kribbella sp. GL6 TaxID=3419765 RepID=UPI003CFF91D9